MVYYDCLAICRGRSRAEWIGFVGGFLFGIVYVFFPKLGSGVLVETEQRAFLPFVSRLGNEYFSISNDWR